MRCMVFLFLVVGLEWGAKSEEWVKSVAFLVKPGRWYSRYRAHGESSLTVAVELTKSAKAA